MSYSFFFTFQADQSCENNSTKSRNIHSQLKNRSKEIGSFRSQVIGGKGKQRQLIDEMKGLADGEREELLGIFSTKVSVTADSALALKAGLMIPWTKLRAMRR